MLFLASLFWNICLTRRGPEEVPAQYALIALLVIGKIVLVLGISSLLVSTFKPLSLTTQIVAWAAGAGLLTALALQLAGHFERFVPTFGAILGTDLLITFLYGVIYLAAQQIQVEVHPQVGFMFNVLSQLWTIFIVGFIMHRALDVNIGLGLTAGLIIKIISQTISVQMAGLT